MNFKEFLEKLIKLDEINLFESFDYEKESFKNSYNYDGNFYNEEWKIINNLNYEISNYGRVRNTVTKKLKQIKQTAYGNQVNLYNKSVGYTFTISRLVAYYFIKKLNKNERVIHINHNICDNYYKNLRIEEI